MFRNVPAYRHLVEICHSGLEEENKVVTRLVAAHQDRCAADGIRIEVVQRGVVPGQVMITVGGGAELRAIEMVEWMERNGPADRVDVYIHPHCLPRPMFFRLPAESAEARRHLLWILSAREVPPASANIPSGVMAPATADR
ncbi:MAG TPA: hypothetical protein VN493_10500 [Thermoanaerobaculia bacterium]|nr:hypothetical protein [Thermoanaerobaculia bacterium]